jgi:pyruvate,orthophosphate dikinase
MLGHRGCRLAVTMPEIYEMQLDAIFAAMTRTEYPAALIEIMIPLTMSAEELGVMRDVLARRQAAFGDAARVAVKFGTMIETPRAALMAGQLAPLIDFASFGSNDLTQMTMGLSRDDAAGFLEVYVRQALLPSDPFVHIDQPGVGQLIELAVAALQQQKHVKIGLCGEHGGDPESIRFLAKMGFDYVSCSPYRLPIARLAAAQAAVLL